MGRVVEAVQIGLAGAAFILGGILVRHGLILLFAKDEHFKFAARSSPSSAAKVLSGNFDPYARKRRDYALAAGLAFTHDGKLVPQGRLSDEVVDSLS